LTLHRSSFKIKKPLAQIRARGLLPRCHLNCRQNKSHRHLLQVRPRLSEDDTLSSANSAHSGKNYSGFTFRLCNSRVHSPPALGPGFHLPRLSGPPLEGY